MNKRILNKAINIAKILKNRKQNICAIIVDKKNNILSIGVNFYTKSHPMQKKYADACGEPDKLWVHAEVNSVSKIPYGRKPYAIYVARVTPSGKVKLAKPCQICSKLLADRGIKNIYYTT
ncbi:MAG: hypothetical protein M0R03_20225 [Novosphingobium sp.]|nr:hypothetical protein [Novosphingobium sp.]